jgi:hypothetical protein
MALSVFFLVSQDHSCKSSGLLGKNPLGLPRLALFVSAVVLVVAVVSLVQTPALGVGEEGVVQVILRQFKSPPTCCQIFFMSSQVPVAQGAPLQLLRLLLEIVEECLVFQ